MQLVDFSQLIIGSFMAASRNEPDLDLDIVRHLVLNQIRQWNSNYKEEYGNMVICCDDRKNWRKESFPNYKINRKKAREKSHVDWSQLYEYLNQVRDELREHFPYKVIHIPTAEADDIIAVLCHRSQEFGKMEPIIILSSDKDFIQLQKYENVKQYSPLQKKWVGGDPKFSIHEKIHRGDAGDGVPNILSGDNVFVEDGLRQKPLATKKVNAWIGLEPESYCTEEMLRNYHRNQTLVDLDKIPESICINITTEFDNQEFGDRSQLLNYFIKYRLKNLTEYIHEF